MQLPEVAQCCAAPCEQERSALYLWPVVGQGREAYDGASLVVGVQHQGAVPLRLEVAAQTGLDVGPGENLAKLFVSRPAQVVGLLIEGARHRAGHATEKFGHPNGR